MADSAPLSTASLTARLRASTAEAHRSIESQINIFKPPLMLASYTNLLQRWLAFHEAWEPLAAPLFAGHGRFFARRSKIDLLKSDLDICGVGPLERPCQLGPIFPSHLGMALGTLYVTEGSTLGGQIISKRVQTLLGFTVDRGGSFFAAYGAQTFPMWNETIRILDEVLPEMSDSIVKAAIDTFAFLGTWLKVEKSTASPSLANDAR